MIFSRASAAARKLMRHRRRRRLVVLADTTNAGTFTLPVSAAQVEFCKLVAG